MNSEVVLTPEKQIMKFPISLRSTKKIVDKSAQRKNFSKSLGLEANTRPLATVGHVTDNF